MAAVRAPLSATNPLVSVFSPFSERFGPPRPSSATATNSMMSIAGASLKAPASDADHLKSPSTPAVAPSPISSDVGTDFADTEEAVEEAEDDVPAPAVDTSTSSGEEDTQHTSPLDRIRSPRLIVVNTSPALPFSGPRSEEPEPQSVIHIPSGFGSFPKPSHDADSESESESQLSGTTGTARRPDLERTRADSGDSVRSDSTITMAPNAPINRNDLPMPPTPLQTTLPITQDWSSTPRAQTRSDLGALSRPPSSLASILEGDDIQSDYPTTDDPSNDEESVSRRAGAFFRSTEDEVAALRTALAECWTLCNTLASLSYIHRERIFAFPNSNNGNNKNQPSSTAANAASDPASLHHQAAWKSCWKLCQNLYDSVYPSTSPSHAPTSTTSPPTSYQAQFNPASSRPTLDLCRDFATSLFDARARDNETADSVLRVSFELNNHLFNTHDRSLPEAFRERTLDFYITLCHRLMKQKAPHSAQQEGQEADSLLRACWSLAEMLFSLRQNAREGRRGDEELLGSAVQSCWELCDLFREGWTQIRPERGTPRPSQATFTQAYQQARRAAVLSGAGAGMMAGGGVVVGVDEDGNPVVTTGSGILGLPETPTTIFEDTGTVNVISPDDPPPQPNILVLGAHGPSEMGLRSTSSTPAPQQHPGGQQIFMQQQQQQQGGGTMGMPMGVNAMNMGMTPMPMSAHPGTHQRRFWSSSSSISAVSDFGATPRANMSVAGTAQSHSTAVPSVSQQNPNPNSNNTNNGSGNANTTANPTPNQRVVRTVAKAPPKPSQPQTRLAPTTTAGEDPTLLLLKTLFVKAALHTNRGFSTTSPDPTLSKLPLFVRSLPETAFGTQVWQVALLENYRKAVANDASFRDLGVAGRVAGASKGKGVRVNATEMARAVKGMTEGVYGFGWLRDLYRLVWGFYVEEALKGEGVGTGLGGEVSGDEGS